ncbi:MAG: transcriptional regulator with XRE-family HTH domain [Gammaproteobacteria bacterium]|jgi:transcriptional regulator with XRE-family HTH domain
MVKRRKDEVPTQLGSTIARLRRAYKLSLSELSEQSGVAKSIISQIERNETNPTLATIWRLSQALDARIEDMLSGEERPAFLQHQRRSDVPLLMSQDERCRLRIIGWIDTVEWVQTYWFEADPGGVLDSEPHQAGSVESLSVTIGSLEVTLEGETRAVTQGETLRYRGDQAHQVANRTDLPATAVMVNILKTTVMT